MGEEIERVSMDEIEAEAATSLPNKEVMSLLDVNANVDLGLDLAAPVDLAVRPPTSTSPRRSRPPRRRTC